LEGVRFQLADITPNPEAWSGARSAVPQASGLWFLASVPLCGINRRTFGSMIGAVPAVAVMKHLVLARLSFELDQKNRLHL
jgi:hypothetical protein